MKFLRALILFALLFVCLVTTGCFTIEQEIFLNADNSGEFVFHVSVPDFPQDMKSSQTTTPKSSPEDSLKEFRTSLTASLPPGAKIMEIKEVHQNGTQGFYARVAFKQLRDVEEIMSNFAKQSLSKNDAGKQMASDWSVRFEKKANRTAFTQKVFVDTSTPKPEKKPTDKVEESSSQFDEQITAVMMSMVKMRFVLHTSSPIVESNADVIMNGNTAVWDCSLAAFLKNKKPIEMKATF
jgi:hypothetical protein